MLDELVESGGAGSRSEAIRLAVEQLALAHRRRLLGQSIVQAYREMPQTAEDDELALTNAIAMTEAEPVVAHGEIWLLQPPTGKKRPVLVITRNEAIPILNR